MRSNFSRIALMGNLPIILECSNGFLVLHMPTIRDEYSSLYDYNFFLGVCIKTLEELQVDLKLPNIKSKYELIKAICSSSNNISVDIIHCLSTIIQDFKYVDDSFKGGDCLIDEEVFDELCNYIAVAVGGLKFDSFKTKNEEKEMTDLEKEWERKKRLHEAKIQKTKSKDGKFVSLDTILSCVCYEFNISLNELMNMNKYTVYFLYSKVDKIASYEVTQIAAGTGNLGSKNKHTYWAN